MTQEERNEIGQVIGVMAVYYGRNDLTVPVISMYIDDFEGAGLTMSEAIQGYKLYRQNPKNVFFPIPAKIIELMRPVVSDETLAREAAARIQEAIVRCGYTNPEAAKNYIGEVGWNVVRRFGGWRYLCENHGLSINPLTFQAQARDLAKSHLELWKAGEFGNVISMPEKKEQIGSAQNDLTNAKDILSTFLLKQKNNDQEPA